MNETWKKMTKKFIWGPILIHLSQIWAPNFFYLFYLYLGITHCPRLSSYAI